MRKINETYFQEGLKVARKEGCDSASAKIFAEGYAIGYEKGLEIGIKERETQMAKEVAIYLAAEGFSVEDIVKVTGADASVVRQWIAEQSPAAS